jgi:hemerythrin superfamily protein
MTFNSNKTDNQLDAIALLKADHDKVSALFAAYEKAETKQRKKSLVDEICTELSVHAQIEEEIFYPAVKAVLNDPLVVVEGAVEHLGIKNLIEQLEGSEPGDDVYDAKVKVLSEYVEHHVEEEQTEMFPEAKKAATLDLVELGDRMAARKADLMSIRA